MKPKENKITEYFFLMLCRHAFEEKKVTVLKTNFLMLYIEYFYKKKGKKRNTKTKAD